MKISKRIGPRSFAVLLITCIGLLVPVGSTQARRRPSSPQVSKERLQARGLVKQGVRKLREGDYVAALELFSRAYRIYPSPKIQFNIGQTYKELGRYLDAIMAYERFLKKAPKDTAPVLLKLARDTVQDLGRRIATLRLQISAPGASVTIDGRGRGVSPLAGPIRLMPGAHSIVVKKAGYVTAVQTLQLKANDRRVLKIGLKRPPRPQVVRVIYKTVRKPRRGLALLWTGVALTGASALVAAIMGGLALREQKRVDNLDLSLAERQDASRRGKLFQRTTDGLLIGAGVVAAGALVWYLVVVRPSGGSRRVRITKTETAWWPTIAPAGGGIAISF